MELWSIRMEALRLALTSTGGHPMAPTELIECAHEIEQYIKHGSSAPRCAKSWTMKP